MEQQPSDIIQTLVDNMGQYVTLHLHADLGVGALRVRIEGLSHLDGVPHVTARSGSGLLTYVSIHHIVSIDT